MQPSTVWLERIPDKDEVRSSILRAATNIDAYSNTFLLGLINPEVVSSSLTGVLKGSLAQLVERVLQHLVIWEVGLQGVVV